MSNLCPQCGAPVPENQNKCNYCGATVAASAPQQPQYQQPQYQQPQYHQAPAYGMPVDTNRSLITYIILTILTCGIYGFYFIYKLAKDVNEMCKEDGDKVGGLLVYILLSYLTCGIYSFYWLYKIQNRLQAAGPRYGINITESGTTVLLWLILGSFLCGIGSFYGLYIIIKSANAVGAAYNARLFSNRTY